MSDYDTWFSLIAGSSERERATPHRWQQALAESAVPASRVIRIPTGMGKTLGVFGAWSWHRLGRADDAWPRRLVWCLPMRVLAEQTEAVVRDALDRLGRLWDPHSTAPRRPGQVGVHLLMGGADPGGEWALFPEESAVLIGTQDMLLSRALNRGYGAARARWPLEFGLLAHDALWVMDEVQLMDVGLATSAQLQAYHDDDASKGFRPRHTWWMSATLQPEWLKSVDTEQHHPRWCHDPVVVAAEAHGHGLGAVEKTLVTSAIAAKDEAGFARRILDEHEALSPGEYGRITLVVCNTVDRACRTFDALNRMGRVVGIELVHSRFRPAERAAWRDRFLSRAACGPDADRIIVATQVVEAGVDISAGVLISELSPWPSLVQRFGRCARYGGAGRVVVVDRGREERTAAPYDVAELEAAWDALARLGDRGTVGTSALEAFEDGLDDALRRRLYPYQAQHLLLRRELDELFDTTPDLTGADLDISRFIRSGEERDLQVFWVDVPPDEKGRPRSAPPRRRRPRREELCSVPYMLARDWLCGEETKNSRRTRLRSGVRAWVWDWLNGQWVIVERSQLVPGRIVCVASDSGGYRVERGYDRGHDGLVPPVALAPLPVTAAAQLEADESPDADALSAAVEWKTIACHGGEVGEAAGHIAVATNLPADLRRVLVLAGRWHDVGKAHPAFQGGIRRADRPLRQDIAKAPDDAWPRPPKTYRTADDLDLRPGLRHELASTLALFAVLQRNAPAHPALLGPWGDALGLLGHAVSVAEACPPTPCEQEVLACSADEFDLLAYLVAAHHGKVRAALHAEPRDQDYRDSDGRGLPIRGVREGDVLPTIVLDPMAPPLPSLRLSLEPANLGLSRITGRSWRERTLGLVNRYGPGALAWLEGLLIAADRRASQLETVDPILAGAEAP